MIATYNGGFWPVIVTLVAIYAFLFGFLARGVWRSKGGDGPFGFALGFFLGVLGLLYVGFARPSTSWVRYVPVREGGHVMTSRIELDNGEVIPHGFITPVVSVGDMDGEAAVEIEGPDGESHWVYANEVRGVVATDKTCPRCAETVKFEAQVCRFCGHEFGGEARDSAAP